MMLIPDTDNGFQIQVDRKPVADSDLAQLVLLFKGEADCSCQTIV